MGNLRNNDQLVVDIDYYMLPKFDACVRVLSTMCIVSKAWT